MAASSHFRGFLLIYIATLFSGASEACIFRNSWNLLPSSQYKEAISSQSENPLVLDKDTVSVVEQTLVKTLIAMGKLKFHCPRDDGLYSDTLDCRKYYKCVSGNFTTLECDPKTGFEPMAKSCIGKDSVPLCQRVQRLEDYKCNATGLETFPGQCEKFILCTGDAAYKSSCNRGDLFDQELKLCLPENEVTNCNFDVKSDEMKNSGNTTQTRY